MKKEYDDELLPENFEQIAQSYSKTLKNKGFIFVSLEEEECNLLLGEVFVILEKMQACLRAIRSLDARLLNQKICDSKKLLQDKFGKKKERVFSCKLNKNEAFLALVSLENLLVIKLMLLSIKSGELEVCNTVITTICAVFADSFCVEGFETQL